MPTCNIKGVKAHCPKCMCAPEKIEYWNCGPIVKLVCPECHFHVNDGDFEEGKWTMEGLINYWNKIGIICENKAI